MTHIHRDAVYNDDVLCSNVVCMSISAHMLTVRSFPCIESKYKQKHAAVFDIPLRCVDLAHLIARPPVADTPSSLTFV